jgi:hypothetical protein
MKLVFDAGDRKQDGFVTDGYVLRDGQEFEVDEDRARYLLSHYFPKIKQAEPAPEVPAE